MRLNLIRSNYVLKIIERASRNVQKKWSDAGGGKKLRGHDGFIVLRLRVFIGEAKQELSMVIYGWILTASLGNDSLRI